MKTIIMKTKNILKIGVFSIIILSLLISPILESNVPKAEAFTFGDVVNIVTWPIKMVSTAAPSLGALAISIIIKKTSPEDICAGVGGINDKEPGAWQVPWTKGWWEHFSCLIQKGIVKGLGEMFSALMNMLVAMILWAFNPATYGGFVKNSAVQNVWTFLRDLINLVLVLELVFIAIATILGIKKYSWQQTLWKLVVVALLVNFSLVIAGMILDVSNFFAYTFLNKAKIENKSIAESMISSFETEKIDIMVGQYELSGVTEATETATKGWGMSLGNFLIATFSIILIGLFAVIALLAVFLAMISRSGIIIALLCFTPVAFAAWIFPDTEKYWKMWWEQFIKWCTFPIIFGLMLWMGVYAVNNLGITQIANEGADLGMIPFMVRVFLFSMFLVGGLIFSVQGGGAVAQFVTKQGSKLGLAAGAFMGTRIKEKIVESPIYKKAGQTLTKVPLLKGVGGEMMITGEKVKAARIKEKEKNLENISLGTLKQLEETSLRSPLERGNYEQRIALTNKLAKMGELGDKSIEFIKLHMQDRNFDQLSISRAVPQDFRIKEGIFGETGPTVKEKVQTLGGIKENKILELTQAKEFIKDQVDKAEKQAKEVGKSEKEIEDIKVQKFNEVIQEIVRTLNPAQLNAFWRAISAKTLIEEEWGGPNGKIMQAIDQLDETKKKFHEEMLPISRGLSEISGVTLPKKPLKEKEEKEEPEEWTHFS